ncbi:hypothetical protein Rhal01_01943 [Rubritalea halochordaticola]|uniref:Uncharacterized protein n=1 Tax=Rubritalea halochordaticola TaxID=714537 RepID=A0ABP9UZ90_9BACT
MTEKGSLQEILAKKKAGLRRMQARQSRVHGRIADYIEQHPNCVKEAMSVVKQRLAGPDRCNAVTREWELILQTWGLERIIAIFRDQDPVTDQLRACSPFVFPADYDGADAKRS